jgi:beta-glucosidase-like glycosyl hydrolase
MFATRHFDHPLCNSSDDDIASLDGYCPVACWFPIDTLTSPNRPANRQLAREAAAQGAVLAKNTHSLLPLNIDDFRSGGKKLAVLGPLAETWEGGKCRVCMHRAGCKQP